MNVRLIWPMLLPATALVGGCALVGPASILNGRSVYNEVINQTEDQQILNTIVRLRYDRTFGMLTVASVTANIRLRSELNAEVGVGSSSNYAGNLVPLSGGVAYEENPTISYIPLGGESFLRRMLKPITVEQALLLAHACVLGPQRKGHGGYELDDALRRFRPEASDWNLGLRGGTLQSLGKLGTGAG